mgnify:FL=1
MKDKIFKNLINYLEEILILIGFLFFIIFGFLISVKVGILLMSISFFILAFLVIKYKSFIAKEGRWR